MSRRNGNGQVKASLMTCPRCKAGMCRECVDVLRSIYTDEMICTCKRPDHSGEPILVQVLDPFTGTVHAPGLTVDIDGEVRRSERQEG